MVLFGSGDSRITPYKKILDLADEHFPPGGRNRKIYPLTELSAAKP